MGGVGEGVPYYISVGSPRAACCVGQGQVEVQAGWLCCWATSCCAGCYTPARAVPSPTPPLPPIIAPPRQPLTNKMRLRVRDKEGSEWREVVVPRSVRALVLLNIQARRPVLCAVGGWLGRQRGWWEGDDGAV